MKKNRIWTVASLVGLAALLALAVVVPTLAQGQQAGKCCFNNPRYNGTCEVTPGEGETCASILDYLNNQNSTGKSYCGNTTVRGGWSQLDCK
jgi:hypothetical protein